MSKFSLIAPLWVGVMTLLSFFYSCGERVVVEPLIRAGVSAELAAYRKAHYEEVGYALEFSIPDSIGRPVEARVEVVLLLKAPEAIILDFRADSAQLSSLRLNGEEVAYRFQDEHIIIAEHQVQVGENRVEISFRVGEQALNRREEFLYTLLVPDRARTLFPCFDQPNLKACYRLSLEVPKGWQAVANGVIESIDSTAVEGRKRIRFRSTEPLSSYLFSFVAGQLSHQSYVSGGREIALYYRETDPKKVAQCAEIARELFEALGWLEEYTGISYPFAKYDCILLPGFQYGGMEHTGATLYNDQRMFLNEHPTLNERLGRSALIAHETAHMWFGDYVTMEWFDEVWTKEVFANYFASLMVAPHFPTVNHAVNFLLDYLPAAYSEDRTAGCNAIRQQLDNLQDAGLVYGKTIYTKSPVVLEMLVRTMGEEHFRKGIQAYLTRYAYGNATWGGLIEILDHYTPHDMQQWSRAWIEQKGMPHIRAVIEGDRLKVTQSDPWGEGRCWPQEVTYLLAQRGGCDTLTVSLSGTTPTVYHSLPCRLVGDYTLVPNVDGRAYGFFELTPDEAEPLAALLRADSDPLLVASLLITFYENVLNQTLDADWYVEQLLHYLDQVEDPLLFTTALGQVAGVHHYFPINAEWVEQVLWYFVNHLKEPSFVLQAFRTYAQLAETPQAIGRLYRFWEAQESPNGCRLSEQDYTALSYKLAIYLPDEADTIVATQLGRITNPDRQQEYRFVAPSVSPRKEARDALFHALLQAENRRIEPWATMALSHLNHKVWGIGRIAYIRPGLEVLEEVQRTGDIFFPTAWLKALLGGDRSLEAKQEVEAFLAAHDYYPIMLSSKIRQQADHLYRAMGERGTR